MVQGRERKHSYVVPCSSKFRDAVSALANGRGVNVADIARSVMLIVPQETIRACPDPGEPPAGDREAVVLKSGPSAGKPWRRKPRLQVRLPKGHEVENIRRALGLALAMDGGDVAVTLEDGRGPRTRDRLREARADMERLRGALSALAYQPIARGVETYADALYVLGFHPHGRPTQDDIKTRFRLLATIYHPDAMLGDTDRMSQLNDAIGFLRRRVA
ncbi:MAG: J domain-containing protein [Proteobacteria bacterium]|nr:J domain-containing protein [Pseudomonadota bacterium]